MCMGGGGDPAAEARKQQQQQQQKIEAATGQINNAFAGFDPAFYQARTKAYETYAMPQLNQQYQNVQSGLYGKLANQGLLNSSAAGVEKGALQQSLAEQQQNIANAGLQQSQALQRQVGQEKASLIGQANVAADPRRCHKMLWKPLRGLVLRHRLHRLDRCFKALVTCILAVKSVTLTTRRYRATCLVAADSLPVAVLDWVCRRRYINNNKDLLCAQD